jgi:hypothetical protein
MARITQFVGLTQRAKRFVVCLIDLPSERTVEGITAGEFFKLRDWQETERNVVFPTGTMIREVVQEIPWASGAVILTCLEVEFGNGQKKLFHQWIACPFTTEFDQSNGTYWI